MSPKRFVFTKTNLLPLLFVLFILLASSSCSNIPPLIHPSFDTNKPSCLNFKIYPKIKLFEDGYKTYPIRDNQKLLSVLLTVRNEMTKQVEAKGYNIKKTAKTKTAEFTINKANTTDYVMWNNINQVSQSISQYKPSSLANYSLGYKLKEIVEKDDVDTAIFLDLVGYHESLSEALQRELANCCMSVGMVYVRERSRDKIILKVLVADIKTGNILWYKGIVFSGYDPLSEGDTRTSIKKTFHDFPVKTSLSGQN